MSLLYENKKIKCTWLLLYLTCESRASKTSSGIGSGQNSSGRKLSSILMIKGAVNIGHTFRNNDERMIKTKKHVAS